MDCSQVPLLVQPCFLNSKLFLICPISPFLKSFLSQEVKTPGFRLVPPLKHSAFFFFITLGYSTNKTRWVKPQKHPESICFSIPTPSWPRAKTSSPPTYTVALATSESLRWAHNSLTSPILPGPQCTLHSSVPVVSHHLHPSPFHPASALL